MSEDMFFGASPEIFRRAEILRENSTPAESALWEVIRKSQLGVRFRRQHPVSSYIVDFYCHKYRLVIELDGPIHDLDEVKEYDEGRSDELQALGLSIIRFSNEEVLANIEDVINSIKTMIET